MCPVNTHAEQHVVEAVLHVGLELPGAFGVVHLKAYVVVILDGQLHADEWIVGICVDANSKLMVILT